MEGQPVGAVRIWRMRDILIPTAHVAPTGRADPDRTVCITPTESSDRAAQWIPRTTTCGSPKRRAIPGFPATARPQSSVANHVRGRDDHRRPERIAIAAVRQLVRLLESLKNTGALRTPIKGPFRRSPATVTSGGSRQRLRDVRIPSAVRLRTFGLESVRFRSAFGRIRRAARRIHRTRQERTPPHLHFVGSRNDVQSGTGQFTFLRSHPGLRDAGVAAPDAAGDGRSSPFAGSETPRRHRHAGR